MTAPVELPIVGKVQFRNTSKEELLKFWTQTCDRNGLKIRYRERVESIERKDGAFHVRSTKAQYAASAVLLAIGRRGTPRKLGVHGEELPKVVYRLIDPEQYRGRQVVVVGGGDSALEAAASIAELGDSSVILSYRGEAFQRAKQRNRQRVEAAAASERLKVLLNSQVREIRPEDVVLTLPGKELKVSNDAIIVSAGGILPNDFLRSIGIEVETKYGTA
jgi:thioredoxin reductase